MNNRIFLLVDYRDQFYFSTRYRGACADIERLKDFFKEAGYELIVKHFSDINFRKENYKDAWVIYQSSEDPGLFYKDYIQDVLVGLHAQGAKLIPELTYFRAHHNKVFMEILRDILPIPEIKSITSKVFGTYEEYLKDETSRTAEPIVLKPGSGTRSSGVKLLNAPKEKRNESYKTSRSFTFDNLKLLVSKLRTGKPYTPMSNNRHKFIVQNFIPGLDGDYRILVYGDKYYAVYRENRDDDFRASGSGKIDFNKVLPDGLLDYAKSIYTQFDTPLMSLDIGCIEGNFHLFEFQCLCLGQYTLEKSKFYYTQNVDGSWIKITETPDLERELSWVFLNHIKTH